MKKEKSSATSKKPITKRWWFWFIIVFLAIGVIGNIGDSDSKTSDSEKQTRATSAAAPSHTTENTSSNDYTIMFGELLGANPSGGTDGKTLVIKAKISSQMTKELTVNQNYHNVEDIIKNQGGDKFECIDYWAVADMSDGSEQKVVAFTVDADTIKDIANEKIVAIQFGDYVDDLFIHSSLREAPQKSDDDIGSAATPEASNTVATSEPASPNSGAQASSNFDTYDNETQQQTGATWVLNTNTMKIHYPTCDSVKKIAPQNYATSNENKDTLISWGYSMCGICG